MRNFFFAAPALFLFACAAGEREAVLILGVMPSMDYLPLAVAVREGYTEQVGLHLEIKRFYAATERDAAFQSGNVDGTVIDYTGALLQKAGGRDLKIASGCSAPFYIIAGKNSGVRGIADLRGKKVSVSQNTVIDFCVDMALRSAGLSGADVEKVEINRIPLRYEMLESGNIDATALPDPLAAAALKNGHRLLSTNIEQGFAITGIMFTGKAVREKSGLIKKMYRAYDMGVEYLDSHGREYLAPVLIEDFGFTEENVQNAAIDIYAKAAPPDMADINLTADWLLGRGLVGADFDRAAAIDPDLATY
ncbi:MAG: ABC transporter substrate-binding protein [Spirochaetaceae bacterium]|jgi:NitT/TauT family transport system substrate-binding protein|nr:ABC transporter substrate-binding protein [Spirochaetaceae bacterium]